MLSNALHQTIHVGDVPITLVIPALTDFAKEIVGVLPIVIPVVITVLALRKGISFLMGTLRGV